MPVPLPRVSNRKENRIVNLIKAAKYKEGWTSKESFPFAVFAHWSKEKTTSVDFRHRAALNICALWVLTDEVDTYPSKCNSRSRSFQTEAGIVRTAVVVQIVPHWSFKRCFLCRASMPSRLLTCGVPRGSVAGPLRFCIYKWPIWTDYTIVGIMSLSDDAQLYLTELGSLCCC